MDHFIHYAAAKSGMSEALDAVIASGIDPFADSRTLLTGAVGTLLTPAPETAPANRRRPGPVLLLMGGIAYSVRHGTTGQAVHSSTCSWTR